MTTLNEHIDTLTSRVLSGECGLDDALGEQETWLTAHVEGLTSAERREFSAALDQESTNDNRSLVDSVLKLHTTRLLYRHDLDHAPAPESDQTPYVLARERFTDALRAAERGINEARIDIAIANAHHLLGNPDANRRWLQNALDRLPDLAAPDLVALAKAIPAIPLPRMNVIKRAGLRLMGFNFEKLADRNRESLMALARMQTDQIIILTHLLGESFEAIRERARARRAFRIAAHLIVRYDGMYTQDAEPLVDIAESLAKFEVEAAHIIAQQAIECTNPAADADLRDRANAILSA